MIVATHMILLLSVTLLLLLVVVPVSPFVVIPNHQTDGSIMFNGRGQSTTTNVINYLGRGQQDAISTRPATTTCLYSTNTEEDEQAATGAAATTSELPEPPTMRIREIKDELNSMKISFQDCFDKDSLVERLIDTRSGKVTPTVSAEVKEEPKDIEAPSPATSNDSKEENTTTPASAEASPPTPTPPLSSSFDKETVATELRSKRVKELRTMCAESGIRWANMIEKEDLVQALLQYDEKASNFSPSGKIVPGKVALIDDDILSKETAEGAAVTPLLLDVFATWCGPCQMMAPFLEEAASELDDKVRVAKMDSDQNPIWPSKLKVEGLPTVLVFDGQTGNILERVEGAMMKDQLVQLAMKHAK